MAVPNSIPKGTLLSGKYKVGRELGRGGMAAVYEAMNVDIGKRVAIKLLAGHLATSQTVVERFLREARAVAKIRSPQICDVYDSGRLDDGTPFLVMELLEGESLYDAMCRDRQMSPALTLSIVLQVSRGLAKAHEHDIVHRDLKPENIFLTVDEDGHLLVKVLDFGLAKFYDPVETKGKKGKHARLTREGAVFGTPAYMSPEQVRGQAAADTRADLWALACITYECFTGTTVWSTEDGVAMTFAQIATAPLPDPRHYRPDLPKSFTAWFHKALDRDIQKRFQTVKDFADELALAFNYQSRGGGLDARLVDRITLEAASGADTEAVTTRVAARRTLDPPAPPQHTSGTRAIGSQGDASAPIDLRPPAPAPEKSSGRASLIAGIVMAALLGLAVAVVVSKSNRQATLLDVLRFGDHVSELVSSSEPPPPASGGEEVSQHPWLPALREAQALIAQQKLEEALSILRRIYETNKSGMIRNLMDQVQIAALGREGAARCQVFGYARPRRFDLLGQDRNPVKATRPSIAVGAKSAIMTWADANDGKRRAYAVTLDDALRNQKLPASITPENERVETPLIMPIDDRYLVSYWDATAGVFVRWLDADGVIAEAPIAVTDHKAGAFFASLARTADGFIVAYADRVEADSVDLFYRKLDKEAVPLGEAVRVTDYINQGPMPSRVRDVQVAVSNDEIHFVYSYTLGGLEQIRYQVVPLATEAPGLDAPDAGTREERVLGTMIAITRENEKSDEPSLACVADGCYVAWTQRSGGAGVAFVDNEAKMQWHNVFAPQGKKASIGLAPTGEAQVVWVEGGRLTTGTLDRSGVGPSSKVARVVGDHPPPIIAPGLTKGEWYIAWLDYESGHQEPYAARMECQ